MNPFCADQHHDSFTHGFQRRDALFQLGSTLPQLF